MIEPPPEKPSLQEAAEWVIRALRDEDLPVMLCGRSALDYQGEHTGSVDIDVLVGTDFQGAAFVLDNYANRGDLSPIGSAPGAVVRYLVSGRVPVDLLNVHSVHPDLFGTLQREASHRIRFGTAETVDVVTREGYFVLAILIGERGFARDKSDPMMKVREGWGLFGERTDGREVNRLLKALRAKVSLEKALEPPAQKGKGKR